MVVLDGWERDGIGQADAGSIEQTDDTCGGSGDGRPEDRFWRDIGGLEVVMRWRQ